MKATYICIYLVYADTDACTNTQVYINTSVYIKSKLKKFIKIHIHEQSRSMKAKFCFYWNSYKGKIKEFFTPICIITNLIFKDIQIRI